VYSEQSFSFSPHSPDAKAKQNPVAAGCQGWAKSDCQEADSQESRTSCCQALLATLLSQDIIGRSRNAWPGLQLCPSYLTLFEL